MSLRAYLAGRAMQGLLSNPDCAWEVDRHDRLAQEAVKLADALIAELKKEDE